jgi:hypothetical protein
MKNNRLISYNSTTCYDPFLDKYKNRLDKSTNFGESDDCKAEQKKCRNACFDLGNLDKHLEESRKKITKHCGSELYGNYNERIGDDTTNYVCAGNISEFNTTDNKEKDIFLDKEVGTEILDIYEFESEGIGTDFSNEKKEDMYNDCKKKAIKNGSLEFSIKYNKEWRNRNPLCILSKPGKRSCNIMKPQNELHFDGGFGLAGSIIENNKNSTKLNKYYNCTIVGDKRTCKWSDGNYNNIPVNDIAKAQFNYNNEQMINPNENDTIPSITTG